MHGIPWSVSEVWRNNITAIVEVSQCSVMESRDAFHPIWIDPSLLGRYSIASDYSEDWGHNSENHLDLEDPWTVRPSTLTKRSLEVNLTR